MQNQNRSIFRFVVFVLPFLFFSWLLVWPPKSFSFSAFGWGNLPLVTMSFLVPLLGSIKSLGRGLLIGTIIAIVYNIFDIVFVKANSRACGDICGLENYLVIAVLIFYFLIGSVFWFKEKGWRVY